MTTRDTRTLVRRLTAFTVVASLFAVGLLIPTTAASAVGATATLESEFLDQLNTERNARGLVPLIQDTSLVSASATWADSMSDSNSLVHSGDGRAEIIAYGYRTGQITQAWMQSSGHRNLIVDPNLVFAGIGVTCDEDGRMWAAVQFLRLDTRLATLGSSTPLPAVTPDVEGSRCGEAPTSPSQAPAVQRLYLAFFLRESDAGGLAYWASQTQSGMEIEAISDFFATSEEFGVRYGELTDREFIARVYLNVLGRQPDEGGYAYWVSQMRGGLTRGELMVGFSDSAEFIAKSGIS